MMPDVQMIMIMMMIFTLNILARYFTFFSKKPRRQFFFVDEELYRTKKFFILFGLLGENHRYPAKKM